MVIIYKTVPKISNKIITAKKVFFKQPYFTQKRRPAAFKHEIIDICLLFLIFAQSAKIGCISAKQNKKHAGQTHEIFL